MKITKEEIRNFIIKIVRSNNDRSLDLLCNLLVTYDIPTKLIDVQKRIDEYNSRDQQVEIKTISEELHERKIKERYNNNEWPK